MAKSPFDVQVTIWPTSNLLADASTNTWSVIAETVTDVEAFCDELETFYKSIVSLYPSLVRQDDHTIKAYSRLDPEPRATVYDTTFSFTGAPSGVPIPPECAFVMSFQGDAGSGLQQSRRRGRVFIGPLKDAGLGTDGRPSSTIITTLKNAGQALLTSSFAATDWKWTVHSSVNDNDVEITNGWVDNEYDTQRRRGRVATSRTTYS
uniref:Uncharacterized protein n=1 Tax=uncultured prokaryote TaxID=198431 RepID=A0A0H5QQ32_9ZZZZ|nr:hypothetical protein [uncultured prokaryote]